MKEGVSNEQDDAHELINSPSISSLGGFALPTRSANVTVFQNGLDQQPDNPVGLVRRDSLEDTKSFYGVRPTSPPSSSSIHRPHSSASKVNNNSSKRVRSASLLSNASSNITSPSSRTAVPLPTPKGFLSPKKPNLALRLEKKERNLSFSSTINENTNTNDRNQNHNNQLNFRTSLSTEYENDNDHTQYKQNHFDRKPSIELISSRSISPLQEEKEEENHSFTGKALALVQGEEGKELNNKASDLSSTIGKGGNLNHQGWDRSIGRSITEMSTPPRTATSELSSDELVHRDRERDERDIGIDIEKGIGNGTSPKSRKSWTSKPKSKSSKTKPYSSSTSSPSSSSQYPHSGNQTRRKYQTFDNPLTTFFWNGKLMTGGDNWWSMLIVAVCLFGQSGVWLGTTGVWLWMHGREYGLVKGGGVAITIIFVYLFGITASSLIASAFRDPGIIPRRLDPDPPKRQQDDYWEAWPREIDVNGGKVTVRYCETCKTYRPPRSSHCRVCGNCVDGIDHHCSYLHNCVGKRNYLSFLVLLVSSTTADIYIIVFSALHFSLLCHHDHISFGKALSESPGAAISFLLGIFLLLPITFLLWFHLRLLMYNLTTVEQIRANTSKSLFINPNRPDNHFSSNSLFDNFILASIGRPQFPSWIDANGFEEVDKREVNPALKDLRWIKEREGL